VWIWKYHFLSIPGMAWIAFVTIGVLILLARPRAGSQPETAGDATIGNIDAQSEPELTR